MAGRNKNLGNESREMKDLKNYYPILREKFKNRGVQFSLEENEYVIVIRCYSEIDKIAFDLVQKLKPRSFLEFHAGSADKRIEVFDFRQGSEDLESFFNGHINSLGLA